MKKIVMIIMVLLLGTILMVTGCSQATPEPEDPVLPEEPPVESSQPEEPSEPVPDDPQIPVGEYSLVTEDGSLTLRAWDDQQNVETFLGQPLTEEVRELGHTADTFAGSWVKTQTYPELRLEWFSPKGDGQRFWLMRVQTTDPQYRTVRDIGVGSTREQMETAYPDILQALDGRTDPDNCAYQWGDAFMIYDQGRFEMEDGVIREILLEHVLP